MTGGGCRGCETVPDCSRSLAVCRHTRAADDGWTYQPEREVILDGDGGIVVEIDPDVTTGLTTAERSALGTWIARGGPEVIAAVAREAGR